MVTDFKLIPNNEYYLTYTDEHCHSYNGKGLTDFKEGLYTFVGQITIVNKEKRNIFYTSSEDCKYVMFGISNPHRYAKPVKNKELFEKIVKLEEELKELKKQLK